MEFSTGNRSTTSRSHEKDVFTSKNAPEVAQCPGTSKPAQKTARERIPWESMKSLKDFEISQGIRSRVVLWAGLLLLAHYATSERFFDGKASFSWLLDAVDRFPVENCTGYGTVYFSWGPKTTKATFILRRNIHIMKVAKMCTGIPTSRIPVSSRIMLPTFLCLCGVPCSI